MGALALPAALAFTGASFTDPVFIASIVIALFVFYTHRANISRLRRGEEHRFRRGGKDGAPQATPPVAPQGPR
jgi:glycerol-3-phosphate acyltransferase PlsY